jgi:hypothetical protein
MILEVKGRTVFIITIQAKPKKKEVHHMEESIKEMTR